jgi:hypothetical protein
MPGLSESGSRAVGDALEAELVIFKDRVERALLESPEPAR